MKTGRLVAVGIWAFAAIGGAGLGSRADAHPFDPYHRAVGDHVYILMGRCGQTFIHVIEKTTGFDPDRNNPRNFQSQVYYTGHGQQITIERIHSDADGNDDWYLVQGITSPDRFRKQFQYDHPPEGSFEGWVQRAEFATVFDQPALGEC